MIRCYDRTVDSVRASDRMGDEYEFRDVYRSNGHYWVRVTLTYKGGYPKHEMVVRRDGTVALECLRRPYCDTLPDDEEFVLVAKVAPKKSSPSRRAKVPR